MGVMKEQKGREKVRGCEKESEREAPGVEQPLMSLLA